jgi:Protein of unknown function (DUF3147)
MKVSANFSALKKTKWYEYAVRFLLGGTVTVVAGLLAKHYGPVFGGLFLAFPAIFPANATLVDKHERQKKQRVGIPQTMRGRQVEGWMPEARRLAAWGSPLLPGSSGSCCHCGMWRWFLLWR